MGEVVLLAGLPGSGKTTYLCQMLRDHWLVFDDYKRESFCGSSEFRKSQKFHALVSALRDGVKCVVADIHFCRGESRQEAEDALREEVPAVTIGWRFFENARLACEANIRSRNRDCLEKELEYLRDLSPVYLIPPGGVVLTVRRNTDRREGN
jgi:predicted kinase